MNSIKRFKTSIYLALTISAAVGLLSALFIWAFSFLGYGVIIFAYIFILIGLIMFYWLTSILPTGWMVLAFILNFIVWSMEQVLFEKQFHNTALYQEEGLTQLFVLSFGALLFALNKVLIDEIFILFGVRPNGKMRIHRIIEARRKAL